MKEKKIKEVRVCNCGAPLHWTFLFDGAEYYCMNCGYTAGMLGAGKIVELTLDLRAKIKVSEDVFKALRKHLIGSGNYQRHGCKKCYASRGYRHKQHLTKYEKYKNEAASELLNALKGAYLSLNN